MCVCASVCLFACARVYAWSLVKERRHLVCVCHTVMCTEALPFLIRLLIPEALAQCMQLENDR
jgi:hypothetical protein